MTVAELAKRFENAAVSDDAITPPAVQLGRVRELTRRLEHAVHSTVGNEENASAPGSPALHQNDDLSSVEVDPEVEEEPEKQEDAFPSPPLLPSVSRALSAELRDAIPIQRLLTPPTFGSLSNRNQPSQPSLLPSSPRTPARNEIQTSIPSSEHSPETLTLQQRLARYEQLTSPVPTPPDVKNAHPPSSPSSPRPSPLAGPSNAPRTPSTEFSEQTSSLSSEQRIELIPDVSEGDLDDIEGVELVEDEERVEGSSSTGTDTFDSETTFHRAQTIETLPSQSQSFHTPPVIQPSPPPSNSPSASNASENSSFSSAEFASAKEEFHQDRPAPHTLAVPSAPRMQSNLSSQPHTLHIAPGSFKKLPKAKVVIARRRHDDDVRISHDDASGRKLIREYENPKELLEGNVSLVEISDDDDDEITEFRDPEISDVRRNTSVLKKHRADAFRHRYDEFMDVHEIERLNEIVDDDVSNSKEKYPRRRLFRRGKVEKARQREERMAQHRQAVARRSTVISGALDRVSLAADPFIDFITDNNTLPTAKAGGLRRGLKRLFGFGRPNAALIKSRE